MLHNSNISITPIKKNIILLILPNIGVQMYISLVIENKTKQQNTPTTVCATSSDQRLNKIH